MADLALAVGVDRTTDGVDRAFFEEAKEEGVAVTVVDWDKGGLLVVGFVRVDALRGDRRGGEGTTCTMSWSSSSIVSGRVVAVAVARDGAVVLAVVVGGVELRGFLAGFES